MAAVPMLKDPNGGRSLPEWIAKSPDSKVPDTVRVRVFLRAHGICHISGRKIGPGERWELEHVKALSMGGEHRESNLRPALSTAHKVKTSEEADPRAKADRVRRKHLGLDGKSKSKWGSRPFPNSKKARQQRREESHA